MTDKISTLRLSVSRLLVIWMWANAGAAALTGYLSDNGWIAPLIMGIVLAGICHICWKVAPLGKSSRLTTAVAFVAVISVMVAAARGSEMQIDLHMYYFAALAVIAASCAAELKSRRRTSYSEGNASVSLSFNLPCARPDNPPASASTTS